MTALDDALSSSAVVWDGATVYHDWNRDSIPFVNEQRGVDLFNDRTIGAGWNNMSVTGQTWTTLGAGGSVQPTDWQVSGNAGKFILAASNSYRACYLSAYNSANHDIFTRMSSPAIPTGAPIELVNHMLVMTSGTSYYLFRAQIETDASLTIKIFNPAGSLLGTLVNALGPIKYTPNMIIAARSQVFGSYLRMKAWVDGSPQPGEWMLTVKTAVSTMGWAGVRSGLPVGITNTLPLTFSVYEVRINDTTLIAADVTSVSVEESLNDNMPDEVTFTSGYGINTATADLDPPIGWRNAEAYYSQFRRDSPIYGLDRDIADVVVNQGVVTASGVQSVQMFNGQMIDLPTDSGAAQISGMSRTIAKLQKLVYPPMITNFVGQRVYLHGLEPTWAVSWCLAQCGLYISPPPRPGNRLWAPMHGSTREFLPVNRSILDAPGTTWSSNGYTTTPQFITGPFFRGLNAWSRSATDVASYSITFGWDPNYQYDIFAKTGNAGRFEMYLKCDSSTAGIGAPDGGTQLRWYLSYQTTDDTGTNEVRVGIDINRKLCILMAFNGAWITRATSATAFTADGAWRPVGWAWDVANNRVVFWNMGVQEVFNFTPSLSVANLKDNDYINRDPTQQSATNGRSVSFMLGYYPIAECQLTGGPQANPDNFPWYDSTLYWDPADADAVIRPSSAPQMEVWYETGQARAIDIINKFAKAELAVTGVDRGDRFNYLPMSYWVETAQQTVSETISADANLGSQKKVGADPSRIRNSVSASYTDTYVRGVSGFGSNTQIIWSTRDNITIPPGMTALHIPFDSPVVRVGIGQGPNNASHSIPQITAASGVNMVGISFLSCNTQPDGSGTYATLGQVYAYWTAATPEGGTLNIFNVTSNVFYLVNNFGYDPLTIYGTDLVLTQLTTASQTDAVSITQRGGERGLAVDATIVNSADWAKFLAAEISARLARPRWFAENVQVFGDPRRTPGQLIRLQDPDGTGLNDLGRIVKVTHNINGAQFEQTLSVAQAWLIGVWDTDKWGQALWGP